MSYERRLVAGDEISSDVQGHTLFTFPVVVGQGTRLFPDTGRDRRLTWSTRE
jgi:hypothetical protein